MSDIRPNREAFLKPASAPVSTPKYMEAHEHREGGLERTVLIAMHEVTQ